MRGRDKRKASLYEKMIVGEAFNGIDLSGRFVESVNDIGEKAATGCKHAVGHVGRKLSVGFGKIF